LIYDTIIAGSGAAGLSAAIYACRYLMKTLVVRGNFGGETATAGRIWNYPGAPGADGYDLMKAFEKQARDTGAERKHLELPNEKELTSKGVHYCVTCDGPLYTGKRVAMVGGGDASIKGILDLAKYVEKIYFIVRGPKLIRPEPVNLEDLDKFGKENNGKVVRIFDTQVVGLVGQSKLEKIVLSKEFNGSKEIALDGLFVEIGAKPDVAVVVSLGVSLDKFGYTAVDNLMQTNVPGIYAAGDTVNHFGPFKQTITAAALGAVAATSAYNYYKKHGNLCQIHWKPSTV